MATRVIFRGLRQLFVIGGLLVILIFCAHQPAATIREIASQAGTSDFRSACTSLAAARGFKPAICEAVYKKFFSSIALEKSLAEFSPKDIGAPAQKIDSKIRFVAFNDANGASALAYCYFVFKGTIDAKSIQPLDLNLASGGFSISSQDIGGYQNWVESTEAGKQCKVAVESQTGYALPTIETELKGNLSLVAVNPLAALNGGFVEMKTLLKEMALTLNHGRILAYMQRCPAVEAWGQKQWLAMSDADRNVISSKLSAYKWDNLQVAGRQYVAFVFEGNPKQVLNLAKGCDL